MKLQIRVLGSGPDIVLLHGWGLHSGVWESVMQRLAADFRVTLIDLPGHGRSGMPDQDYTLPTLAAAIARVAPPRAVWMGWSLGGMAALQLAIEHPGQVSGLILVAAMPRFVRAPDWPHAMEAEMLETFARALEEDYQGTLQRFLALQTLGGAHGAETLRTLRELAARSQPPHPDALRGGLAILRSADLRPRLGEIACPVQLILGKGDRLVPVAAGATMKERLPGRRLHVIKGAGHAPFLSHPDEFLEVVNEFLHE